MNYQLIERRQRINRSINKVVTFIRKDKCPSISEMINFVCSLGYVIYIIKPWKRVENGGMILEAKWNLTMDGTAKNVTFIKRFDNI